MNCIKIRNMASLVGSSSQSHGYQAVEVDRLSRRGLGEDKVMATVF